MTQEFIFEGNPPARFDEKQLQQEIAAVAPAVKIVFNGAENWPTFPYDNNHPIYNESHPDYPPDLNAPWTQPARLVVSNVPDGVTRTQVQNFITNHSASETSDEILLRTRQERMKPALLELINNDSDVRAALGLT